jgi:negative regulator of flagellin synthesis FlgM
LKITSNSLKSLTTDPISGARSAGSVRSGKASSGSESSSAVDLSAAARHMSSLENTGNDINIVKVQALRDAIASGQLQIDPSRIADGLLASARDLLK